MKPTLLTATLSLTLTLAFLAPAAAADKETRQMMADIRMLQEQAQTLQNLLGSVGEALRAVNARLDQQAETNRKAFADQKVVSEAVSADLRVVRERMDDNTVRIGSLAQEVDALRQTVQQLSLAATATFNPDAAAGTAPDGSAPPMPALGAGTSPTLTFESARADFYAGQYELAIAGLQGYIRSFPKSEQADDAQLLIGNSYMADHRDDKALEAYDLVIRNYPKSDVLPEAYYRKGLAHQNLKQIEQARQAYDYLMKNFPDSDAAILTKQLLQKLGDPKKP